MAIEYWQAATILVNLFWVAWALHLVFVAGSHLWRYHNYRRTRGGWANTGYLLASLTLMGIGTTIKTVYWMPWHLSRFLGEPWLADMIDDHPWLNFGGSLIVCIALWSAFAAFRSPGDRVNSRATDATPHPLAVRRRDRQTPVGATQEMSRADIHAAMAPLPAPAHALSEALQHHGIDKRTADSVARSVAGLSLHTTEGKP